ncbi:MAG: hypothetical protein AAGI63_15615 [Planctomycetota bacterium]
MAFRTKVILTVVAGSHLVVGVSDLPIVHPFEHLMEFCQMIDVIVCLDDGVISSRLDVDVDDEARLFFWIDLALTTIASVVDHPSSACRVFLTPRSATTRDLDNRKI